MVESPAFSNTEGEEGRETKDGREGRKVRRIGKIGRAAVRAKTQVIQPFKKIKWLNHLRGA
jgi:hypothetical protein